jgi:hypothetical protein
MISLEAIGYVERLLATRGITDYYLDVYSLVLDPLKTDFYTEANRGFLYLLTHGLPEGTRIASETNIVEINAHWQDKGITKIQEFGGQIAVHFPAPGSVNQLEFFRALPR